VSRLSGLASRLLASPPRSTRHRLHAVRFARLVRSLRRLVDLGDDASDKLGGEWILDRSYVASFVQRALERAREVVFDAAVLSDEGSTELLAQLDAERGALARLMAATLPGSLEGGEVDGEGEEEPEYRLLRAAISRLTLASITAGVRGKPMTAGGLAGVLQNAHERALRSFQGLHVRSWGRRAGRALVESGFPGSVHVVDVGAGVSPAADGGWASRVTWNRIASRPLRAMLDPQVDSRPGPALLAPSPMALALVAEERSTLAVTWPSGSLVVHARLEEYAASNVVYCALRGVPTGSAQPLAEALTDSGFRLFDLGPGLTGWMSGADATGTAAALRRIGGSLKRLLRTP
jgi:hypothetical protein